MPGWSPLQAIAWAQWRTSRNFFTRANRGGLVFKILTGLIWYGLWISAAVGEAFLTSGRFPQPLVIRAVPVVLFFICFFWQIFPIMLASQGAYIDMRRLLVYPIPSGQLFLLEVVLRITTAVEMLLLSAGLAAGLALNPRVPWWGAPSLALFVTFNLLLASGIKSLLGRLFQKKGVREIVMVVFLSLILLPQFFVAGIEEQPVENLNFLQKFSTAFGLLPWTAASQIALGQGRPAHFAAMLGWVMLAYLFARLQFSATLALDDESGSANAKPEVSLEKITWLDRLARFPARFLLDPIAALVEKDIRTLVRSPRFRLIFLMASTFGAVLWLPQALRSRGGWMAQNYVTMAVLYGMLVLGEVIYWNVFGFERAGAQQWFVTPLSMRQVLRAKNFVAVFFTGVVAAILCILSLTLPVGIGWRQVADALAASAVFAVFLLAGGNLTSVYMPKPIDGEQAWRNSSGKTQFLLLFVYPLIGIPVGMAYLARWASDSLWAYYAVLGVSLIIALCFYTVATDTAVEVAEARKEQIVATLSHTEGPISITG